MRSRAVPIPLLAAAVLVLSADASAQSAAKFFEDNCAVCHTVGGGDQVGPDLKRILQRQEREWLIRYLYDPNGLAAAGDEYAIRLVKSWNGGMPGTEGLTRQTAEELVAYIEKTAGPLEKAPASAAPAARPEIAFSPEDRSRGLALFIGRERLSNAGPACVSCHQLTGHAGVSGGRLGPDLTAVQTRLGGAHGTMAWLSHPPTPVMRALYSHSALTDDESRSFAALFESAAAGAADPVPDRRRLWLALAALALVVAGLAVIGLGGRHRLRGVRRRLIETAHRPAVPLPNLKGTPR